MTFKLASKGWIPMAHRSGFPCDVYLCTNLYGKLIIGRYLENNKNNQQLQQPTIKIQLKLKVYRYKIAMTICILWGCWVSFTEFNRPTLHPLPPLHRLHLIRCFLKGSSDDLQVSSRFVTWFRPIIKPVKRWTKKPVISVIRCYQ